MKKAWIRRVLAQLLVLALLAGTLPLSVLATGEEQTGSGENQEQTGENQTNTDNEAPDNTGDDNENDPSGTAPGENPGENSPTDTEQETPTITGISVTLDKSEKIELTMEENQSATRKVSSVKAVYSDGSEKELPAGATISYSWSLSKGDCVGLKNEDTAIVTVEPAKLGDGRLSVTVTAKIDNKDYTKTAGCDVSVTRPAIKAVSLDGQKLYLLDVDETLMLEAKVFPEDADLSKLQWSSEKDTIAGVNPGAGVSAVTVTALSPGDTKIYVKVEGMEESSGSAYCDVTVNGLLLNKTELDLVVGNRETLSAEAHGRAEGIAQEWKTSNNTVVAVSGGTITARAVGTATVTVTAGEYSATCDITVRENTAGIIKDDVGEERRFSFSELRSRLYNACDDILGTRLSYVTNLAVPTEQGILHYNYISPDDPGFGVGSTEKYYYSDSVPGGRSLSDVTFIPRSDFSGTAEISYSGFDSSNQFFTGIIRLTVDPVDDVSYNTPENTEVWFLANDFAAVCMQLKGRELSYVTIDQPSATRGAVYSDYYSTGSYDQPVTSDERFYRNRDPHIDSLRFVPADDFTGTVLIGYRAVDTAGERYTGQISVTVSRATGSSASNRVEYTVDKDEVLTLRAADFNELCRDENRENLDYLRFVLPDEDEGLLCRGWHSGSYDALCTKNDMYFYGGSPSISQVSFLPAEGFTGTVDIPFYGYDTDGYAFDGTLRITVRDEVQELSYTVASGGALALDSSDFNAVCRSITGSELSYVRFTELPDSDEGILCYEYSRSDDEYSSKVNSNRSYYRSGGTYDLDEVSFVAGNSYTGILRLSYTGRSVDGERYTDELRIRVVVPEAQTIRYSGGSLPISLYASDFDAQCRNLLGRGLDNIRFTVLSEPSAGKLWSGYSSPGSPGTAVTTGRYYYADANPRIDSLRFVPQADFAGTVTLAYLAQDDNGQRFTGTVDIDISRQRSSSAFSDMGNHLWAVPSVDFLYLNGVTGGVGGGSYGPAQSIRRGDFVLMLCRAFNLISSRTDSFPDVPANSYYAQAVATAKSLGIAQGSNGFFHPDQALSRQDAMVLIRRTLAAAGRNVPDGPDSLLYGYSDGADFSAYARSAASALIQAGVIRGDDLRRLQPQSDISRAEMAVILHRVLTLP